MSGPQGASATTPRPSGTLAPIGEHVPTLEQRGPAEDHVRDRALATRFVHAGFAGDPATGAVVPPLHLTTTYAQSSPGVNQGYEYSRTGNPTRRVFEDAIATIEDGARGFGFASGMAATDALLRLLRPGDHVVASNNLYGGTHRLFSQVLAHYGLEFDYVDMRSVDQIEGALRPETRIVWVETPTNPNLYLTDIAATARLARQHEAAHGRQMLVVVDNTFATPFNHRPITLGADVVLHSCTKYIGGHSDVVGGALVVNDDALGNKLHFLQNSIGGIMDPFTAYMAHRGIKTLDVRMARSAANAAELCQRLKAHPKVETVWYPGDPENPQHALAERQMTTPGAMLSFEVEGGYDAGVKVMENVRLWTLAESLGAVESLVDHPASMTHGAIPAEQRAASGLTEGLIRLSVGIEDVEDLWADLEQALGHA